MDLLALLADQGIIDRSKIPSLQHDAGDADATPSKLEEALVKNGITPEVILKAKSDYYQIPSRGLGDAQISFDILQYVPEESARYYRLAPIGISEGALEIGITDPDNLEARDVI